MEDDLPTEYDVVVVGTGIDFYQNDAARCPRPQRILASNPTLLAIMIPDRYDRVHRRRGGKQDRQEGSAPGQVIPRCPAGATFSYFLH